MNRQTLQFISGLILSIVGIFALTAGDGHTILSIGFGVWGVGSLIQAWMKRGGSEIYPSILVTAGSLIVAFDFFFDLYKR